MRLINADKLKPTVGMFIYRGEGEDDADYIAVRAYRCELIEKEAPTVKAIPIEWLKKKYGWLTMMGEIIKDWEKENEK